MTFPNAVFLLKLKSNFRVAAAAPIKPMLKQTSTAYNLRIRKPQKQQKQKKQKQKQATRISSMATTTTTMAQQPQFKLYTNVFSISKAIATLR